VTATKTVRRYASVSSEELAGRLMLRCLAPTTDAQREIAGFVDVVHSRDPELLLHVTFDLLTIVSDLRLAHHAAVPDWQDEVGEWGDQLANLAVAANLIDPCLRWKFADTCVAVAAVGAGMGVHLAVLGCDSPAEELELLIAVGRLWAHQLATLAGTQPLLAADPVITPWLHN
jgi:hypothetical protein